MVGRSRVAAYADVPIAGAGSNACTGCRLVRHRRAVAGAAEHGVIQRHHVLLIHRADTASTHAELALKEIVLLTMFTLGESNSEIPAPSHPATLSTMMLLVTVTRFHCPGSSGKATMSDPLTAWKPMPPPVPLSAAFPMIRLALITSPGPTPSLGPIAAATIPAAVEGGPQSRSVASLPLETISGSGGPVVTMPPP